MNETKIKTVSEERDEAIWLMNRTSLELNKTKAQLAATEKAAEERLHRLMDEQRISSKLSDMLSATEQALQEVQRESAELREERDGMRNLTVEECATIAKVAAEGVESWDMRSIANHIENKIRALTNPNYRLAEPSDVDEKEDGLGFFPGFPPGFDVKRAEKGLAQEGVSQGIGGNEARDAQAKRSGLGARDKAAKSTEAI